MEERVFNGLRLPSPPPTPRENRISAVAIGRQVPALEPQRRTLSPLAADFVPIFRNPTNNPRRSSSRSPGALRGCSSSDIPSKDSHMCDPKPQRCALSGVRAYDESMTRGRTRCGTLRYFFSFEFRYSSNSDLTNMVRFWRIYCSFGFSGKSKAIYANF